MKIGDLVRSTTPGNEREWIGLIIGWDGVYGPVVYWDKTFPAEQEYPEQLEVISEIR